MSAPNISHGTPTQISRYMVHDLLLCDLLPTYVLLTRQICLQHGWRPSEWVIIQLSKTIHSMSLCTWSNLLGALPRLGRELHSSYMLDNYTVKLVINSFSWNEMLTWQCLSGFHTGFFLGGENICVRESWSAAAIRHRVVGGSGGMLPQKNFEILSPLRVIFKPSESDLRPSTD